MSAIDALIVEIFGESRPAWRGEFEAWVRGSRRYQAFATTYRAKIRAKLRNARHPGSDADLWAELATAAALLREPSFAVAYETYAARRQRGPDFTVTYKTHTPFNVEVRRLRGGEGGDDDARVPRLMSILCDKVGQMPAGIINVLWLIDEGETTAEDVMAATAALRRLADANDERRHDDYFSRRGFADAADFRKQYPRLSAVALRRAAGTTVLPNPAARHKLPVEIGRVLERI